MAVLFLLLIVIAQTGFLVVARTTAAAATSATARRAALSEADHSTEEQRLIAEIEAAIPGAVAPAAAILATPDSVEVRVTFRWVPPGPDLVPITIRISSHAPRSVPP